jgi:hypothetical protein
MIWPHAFIAVLMRRLGYASPALTASCQPESAAISGTAQTMPVRRKSAETPNLERRALMYYNRDQARAALYLAKHNQLRQASQTFSGDSA